MFNCLHKQRGFSIVPVAQYCSVARERVNVIHKVMYVTLMKFMILCIRSYKTGTKLSYTKFASLIGRYITAEVAQTRDH